MNKNFLLNLQKTNNINDYVKVIDEFSTIIDKGIIVSRKNYAELFFLSIR